MSTAIAELLLLAGRLVQAEGYNGELSPAQWMALRYFARANPFSRTPSAFAEFQATTRGTALQAIKALEAGGYLVRQRSKADGRSVSLRLTNKAKKALTRDPFEAAIQQAQTPRPLNANCSASRSSQRTRVFSASIFSQRATAMAHITNELTPAICAKDA